MRTRASAIVEFLIEVEPSVRRPGLAAFLNPYLFLTICRGFRIPRTPANMRRVIMKVVTLKDIPDLPVEGADRIAGWSLPRSAIRN